MVSCSGFGLPLHAQLLRLFVTRKRDPTGNQIREVTRERNVVVSVRAETFRDCSYDLLCAPVDCNGCRSTSTATPLENTS